MKFSTVALCLFFCWCQVLIYAQTENDLNAKIKVIEPSTETFEERMIHLEESEKKEAAISLQLIQLRIQIAELEIIGGQSEDKTTQKVLEIKERERALIQRLARQKKWTSLLEHTLYYPEEERKLAFKTWQEEQKQIESKSTARASDTSRKVLVKEYTTFSQELDLISYPPSFDCKQNNEVELGRTATQQIFSHTDKELENYFPKRDFISGFGSFSTSPDGYKIFHLTLLVASPKADKIYGFIPNQEFMVLFLLDGQKVSLRNRFKSKGNWDVTTQSYFYQCQYLIGPKEEKILKNMEADKILIKWNKTTDEYEIFELDFFRNHLRCLENQ